MERIMANSNMPDPKKARGLYKMKALGEGQARVWVSDGETGFAAFEDVYRAGAYAPLFETLPTRENWISSTSNRSQTSTGKSLATDTSSGGGTIVPSGRYQLE
jgi:hypothetical protein